MALNIKDPVVEQLVADLAQLTGESKTRAVRVALEERRARLAESQETVDRATRLRRFLEIEAWPMTAPNGPNPPMTKAEREEILGYGPEGV